MTAAKKQAFEVCKGCGGTGYKEGIFRDGSGFSAPTQWKCLTCKGAGKLGLPDYPIRAIPLDMYKCGYCGKFNRDKGSCSLHIRIPPEGGYLLPTDVACFRIDEFYVGAEVGK